MDLLKRFKDFIEEKKLPLAGRHFIIAVSGGIDSVVLCHLCKKLEFSFAIAHCNFRLRGEESDRDEIFVRDLASQFGVEYLGRGFDTDDFARNEKLGIQEAARKLRYAWFEELLSAEQATGKKKFDFLLTAHHADDNIETLLMNFFKGTGINGLSAMQPAKNRILRPLLFAFREEIGAYASAEGISWREDASNLSRKYTRNYFRHDIIPAIEKVFPEVRSNLFDNIRRFEDIRELYLFATRSINKSLVIQKGEEWHVPVLKLAQQPGVHSLIYELIRDFGFSPAQTEDVAKLMQAGTGKHVDSFSHRILKNRNWLIILPLKSASVDHLLIGGPSQKLSFDGKTLQLMLGPLPEKISASPFEAMLDASRVQFPLLLRKWKQGDYFYPLGMRKKKKLSRFFIDLKIPLHEKENIRVLESAGRILWVIGYRIDDRFKLQPSTGQMLHITCQ